MNPSTGHKQKRQWTNKSAWTKTGRRCSVVEDRRPGSSPQRGRTVSRAAFVGKQSVDLSEVINLTCVFINTGLRFLLRHYPQSVLDAVQLVKLNIDVAVKTNNAFSRVFFSFASADDVPPYVSTRFSGTKPPGVRICDANGARHRMQQSVDFVRN